MNTATTTISNKATSATITLGEGYFAKRSVLDWAFALFATLGAAFALSRYSAAMDFYDKSILVGLVPAVIWLGWFWRPLRNLMLVVTAFSLLGVASYQGNLARAETVFWLKYFLSSQSAILWMSVLFFMSTVFYWLGVFATTQSNAMESLGSKIAWAAVSMALIGTMVRWY